MEKILITFEATKEQRKKIRENAKLFFGGNVSLYLRTIGSEPEKIQSFQQLIKDKK
jgi:hypothetical protein